MFEEFESKTKRVLPVFLLIDTSGSMKGQKIEQLNLAYQEMIQKLRDVENTKGEIHVCVVTFGGSVQIFQPIKPIKDIALAEFSANGNTPMGEAITCVVDMIEDNHVVPKNCYTPTIILVSDGIPTDIGHHVDRSSYEKNARAFFDAWDPIKRMNSSRRTLKSVRLALGIGDDANPKMLQSFINNDHIPVIKASSTGTITRFFEWVTLSISIKSVNPENEDIFTDEVSADELFNSEDIFE